MGRYYYDKKDETNDYRRLSIFRLKKWGYFQGLVSGSVEWSNAWGKNTIGLFVSTVSENKYARLTYTRTYSDDTKEDFDYNVQLATSPCYYGGVRYWFVCPLVKDGIPCQRRVGILYQAGKYFGCRHCYSLTYESRNQNRRGSFFALHQSVDILLKRDELEDSVKRKYYAGKPTKRYLRWLRMNYRLYEYSQQIKDED